MLSNYMFKKIRKMSDSGQSNIAIAKKLKIHRKTVAKYKKSNNPPIYERHKKTKISHLEPFKKRIIEWLNKDHKARASDIFLVIKESGYKGCERSVYSFVAYSSQVYQ